MTLSEKKVCLVIAIDQHVKQIIARGGGDEELLISMHDKMETFKQLLDTCSSKELGIFCQRYEGFYRYAKLLDDLAQGIADGTISVP